jgi:hypothetical protein
MSNLKSLTFIAIFWATWSINQLFVLHALIYIFIILIC